MNRIGLSTITWHKLPVEEALQRTADLGFATIDLGVAGAFCPHFDPREPESGRKVVDLSGKLGLSVSTLNTVPSIFGAEDHDELLTLVRACIDLAKELGAYGLTLDSGFPRKDPWEEGARPWAEFVKRAWEAGSEAGIELSIEAPHKGSHSQAIEEAEAMLDLLPDQIGITYDSSHAIYGGSDAADSLRRVGGRIKHVHLRDGRGDDINLTPGDGDYDFAELFRYMQTKGYKGDFNMELEYGEAPMSADEIGAEAVRAREYIEKVLAGL